MDDGLFDLPVVMLRGFGENPCNRVNECGCYGAYSVMLQRMESDGADEKAVRDSVITDFSLNPKAWGQVLKIGAEWRDRIEESGAFSPYAEVSALTLWAYNKARPPEDYVVLLAYIAVKSILGIQAYRRISSSLLLSRMCGSDKAIPFEDMPKDIARYASRKLFAKLRYRLFNDFSVASFAQKGKRGCYFSTQYPPEYLADKVMGKLKPLQRGKAETETETKAVMLAEDEDAEFQRLF